jgi:predicted DNA-binding protein (MmcQ/YjbR family)
MDNERIREICLTFPHVTETLNWGHHLVYWVGDREMGGKMFAMTDVDGVGTGVLWFHCGAERFHELLESEGIIPAPYLAKAYWVAVERWDALRAGQYESELRQAYALILAKLPLRARKVLEQSKSAPNKIGAPRAGARARSKKQGSFRVPDPKKRKAKRT